MLAKQVSKLERSSSSEYVLVVEDDANISNLIKIWMELRSFKVLLAENGEDALKILKNHPERSNIRLITTDILMPKMDGSLLINRIKSDPEIYHIPIIVLSIIDKFDLGNFFADAYLKKPFDGFDLLKIVDDVLSN